MTEVMTSSIGTAWREARNRFRAADVDTPELDARLLAQAAFGLDQMGLLAHEKTAAPGEGLSRLQGFAARRLEGEPVARILGYKEFYGLEFKLNDATLVPRPETEMLVDVALGVLLPMPAPRFLDLGTGTGCVAIAVLVNVPAARAVAIDLSPEALVAAQTNAIRHGVIDRIAFRTGSWCAPLLAGEQFDLVLSNPPYVETEIIEDLSREVSEHDPRLALDGGEDGLAAYRHILADIAGHLKPRGTLAVEIGSEQGLEVGALLSAAGFADIDIRKDLAGLDRVALAHQIG
ncbi:MAG: peptide chain release factor N(5)-glutamine methyltransferase [Devosia sp.]|nr:peptide chain release factor N(5)-glutamine methyltransferase [Devosia sp.]